MANVIAEGFDFGTYQPDDRNSGWRWYCAHCATGFGWRAKRVDARKDARTHVGTHDPESIGLCAR
jgi:hypothetical protein